MPFQWISQRLLDRNQAHLSLDRTREHRPLLNRHVRDARIQEAEVIGNIIESSANANIRTMHHGCRLVLVVRIERKDPVETIPSRKVIASGQPRPKRLGPHGETVADLTSLSQKPIRNQRWEFQRTLMGKSLAPKARTK